jgi:HNH endonuclease
MEWVTEDAARDAEALEAVRRFVEQHGQLPTQDSWTAAAMTPCERTVRKRFGSFRAAAQLAGIDIG